MDSQAIGAWQLERAWAVAERVASDNPFYREWLTLPRERDADAFRSLATTRKDDVVADCRQYPPYGLRSNVSGHEFIHTVETSGTTGHGKEIYALDRNDEAAIYEAEATGFWWAGARAGSPVLLCLPITMQAAGQWYYGGLRRLGANVLSAGSYPTERKISLLQSYQCELIVTTPSYAARLTDAVQSLGLDPAKDLAVRSILVAGEPYGLDWARQLEDFWGARLYEQYGCTERALAWACPPGVAGDDGLRTLHFPPEIAYVEIIDRDSGRHVDDGQFGELVVTPLLAEASPLVRFATGDRVRYIAPGSCDCGRPLGGIAAGNVFRFDDMMKVRGTNLWPGALDAAILGIQGVGDYRGLVRHDDKHAEVIEIHLELEGSLRGTEVAESIATAVKQQFNLSVKVMTVAPGGFGDVGNATQFVKIKRWRDERNLASKTCSN